MSSDLWFKIDKKTDEKIKTKRWGIGSRWQVTYTDLEGKRTSKTFEHYDTAELFDAQVRIDKVTGTLISASKKDVTLAEVWQPWLDGLENASEKYRKDCISKWNVHIKPVWGRRKVAEIQEHQVVAWIAGLTTMKGVKPGEAPKPLGSSSRRKIALIMKSLFERAKKMRIIHANPLDGAKAPKQKPAERRYLKIEEIDALINAAWNDQIKLLLEVLLRTGLRPGEAKGLKVRDLDADRRRITVRRDVDDLGRIDETKNRQHRDVPISQYMSLTLARVTEGRDPNDWLIPDEFGKVWTDARWRVVWENLLTLSGVDRTLKTYELRHTAISMAIAGGADVYVVQRMVGHASAATTLNVYGHLWDHGLDEAAEAIEEHLEKERRRVEQEQARRAAREKASGVRHLRVVR